MNIITLLSVSMADVVRLASSDADTINCGCGLTAIAR